MTLEAGLTQTNEFEGNEGSKQMKLPRKSINQEWFFSTLLVIRDMDSSLGKLIRVDDPRPVLLARQIINRILDDDIKYALLDKYDEALKAIESNPEFTTADMKCAERIRVSQDFVGEVNSYLDEFLALHKGQEIGDV